MEAEDMSKRHLRKKYLVDSKVQGALIFRTARLWLLSIVVVGVLTILGWMFVSPGVSVLIEIRQLLPSLLGSLAIAGLASLLVLPIVCMI